MKFREQLTLLSAKRNLLAKFQKKHTLAFGIDPSKTFPEDLALLTELMGQRRFRKCSPWNLSSKINGSAKVLEANLHKESMDVMFQKILGHVK